MSTPADTSSATATAQAAAATGAGAKRAAARETLDILEEIAVLLVFIPSLAKSRVIVQPL